MWNRIEAIKILREGDSIQFILRDSLLFMIHNLPAYDTLISLNDHGYHQCPSYIFNGFVRHSKTFRKHIYCGNCAYL